MWAFCSENACKYSCSTWTWVKHRCSIPPYRETARTASAVHLYMSTIPQVQYQQHYETWDEQRDEQRVFRMRVSVHPSIQSIRQYVCRCGNRSGAYLRTTNNPRGKRETTSQRPKSDRGMRDTLSARMVRFDGEREVSQGVDERNWEFGSGEEPAS